MRGDPMTASTYMRVCVIVVTLDPGPSLFDTLAPFGDADGIEIVIVDNASTDGIAAEVAGRWANVRVIDNDRNVGFAPACQQAASMTDAEYLLFLNSDASLEPGGLDRLLSAADGGPSVGAVQPVVVDADGRVENAGEWFTWTGFLVRRTDRPDPAVGPYPVFAATAACLLVRRSAFEAAGGFEPGYFAYHEDVDLTWRMRLAGWDVIVSPEALAIHRKHETTRRILSPHDARFLTFRNRLWTLLVNAEGRTLWRTLPVLVSAYVVSAVVLTVSGRPRSGWAALRALAWPLLHGPEVGRRRRAVEHLRRRSDRELMGPGFRSPFFRRGGARMLRDHVGRW